MRTTKKLQISFLTVFLILLLVFARIAFPAFPAYAADSAESVVSDTFDDDGINITRVTADVVSDFNIIIPKTITLSGATKSAAYTVRMSGRIPANTAVNVVPDSTFFMSSPNKPDITVSVTQDKTSWTDTESGVTGNGTLFAPDMTAGRWSGAFRFRIEFVELECPHEWREQTKVVHHDEVSHMETVVVKEAWDETITTDAYVCNQCGRIFTKEEYGSYDAAAEAWAVHSFTDGFGVCQNYSTKKITTTIHHDAVTEQRKVVDKSAYDETVITGYICSKCGETKAP